MSSDAAPHRVFRLPALAYVAVLFLLFGTAPLAFTTGGYEGEEAHVGAQTLWLLVPIIAAVFIARWATIVDSTGITIRAAFGKRALSWAEVRGLSVKDRSVYAITDTGAWRLPCVHVRDLAMLSRATGGRLPEIDFPTPKFAPSRRRRR